MNNMKRIFTALIVLAVSSLSANAAGFRFGVKAGVNIDKIHFNDVATNFESNNRAGFTGGVMTEFQVPLVGLCFDASLMYTRMNSQVDEMYLLNGSTAEKKGKGLDYFNIPINLKYKISLPVVGSIISPYLFTGPDFAFRLSGSENVFKTKAFQCAWNLGVGVELVKHLQVSGSYAWGMNNIFKHTGMADYVADGIKAKNNYWTITAAYLF